MRTIKHKYCNVLCPMWKRETDKCYSLILLLIQIVFTSSRFHKLKSDCLFDSHEIQSFISNHNKIRLHYYKNVTVCHNPVSLQIPSMFTSSMWDKPTHYLRRVGHWCPLWVYGWLQGDDTPCIWNIESRSCIILHSSTSLQFLRPENQVIANQTQSWVLWYLKKKIENSSRTEHGQWLHSAWA